MVCGKLIHTADNNLQPCLCVLGHAGGCNPFSPNPYMAAVMAKEVLPKRDAMPLQAVTPYGVVWTDRSVIKRCLWQGANGRCIYEMGHTVKHQEESNHHGN